MNADTASRRAIATITKALTVLEQAEHLNAVQCLLTDIASSEAAHLDRLTDASISLGALHGVPIVIKDIIDVAGTPTFGGSATRAGSAAATADATVVRNLRAAGAVTVAKSNTVEYAFGGWGTNEYTGPVVNPWSPPDYPHTSGGSSSGTGALVGAGAVPAGLGTDTGGSVRIPAAFCGTVGLKTSVGLVSRAGVLPLSDTFDTVGPLTDTVRRAAQTLAAMQGEDPADPTTVGVSRANPLGGLGRSLAGIRLARPSDEALADMTPAVATGWTEALRHLEEGGATLVTVSLPLSFLEYQKKATLIISTDAFAFWSHLAEANSSELNETTRTRMLAGRGYSAADRIRAQRNRDADIANFLAAIDCCDALVMPTAPTVAIPHALVNEDNYSVSLYTRWVNYLALCGISLPVGLTADGLPTALQVVGRRLDDPLLLRIGAAFEAIRGPFLAPNAA